jgi:hypothetical protein
MNCPVQSSAPEQTWKQLEPIPKPSERDRSPPTIPMSSDRCEPRALPTTLEDHSRRSLKDPNPLPHRSPPSLSPLLFTNPRFRPSVAGVHYQIFQSFTSQWPADKGLHRLIAPTATFLSKIHHTPTFSAHRQCLTDAPPLLSAPTPLRS